MEVKGIKGTVFLQEWKGRPISHQFKWGCFKSVTLYYVDINWQTAAGWKCGIVVSIPPSGWLAQGSLCFEFDFPKCLLMYPCMFPLGKQSTPTPDSSVLFLSVLTPPSFKAFYVKVRWKAAYNCGLEQTIISSDPKGDVHVRWVEKTTTPPPPSMLILIKSEIFINSIPSF